jgi:hypothetical protein
MEGTMVVTIHRPAGMKADAFLKKLQHDVFPTVHKGPTRIGGIDSWTLLSEDVQGDAGESPKYVWLVNWGGLEGTAELLTKDALEKLRALGATIHETNYATVISSVTTA